MKTREEMVYELTKHELEYLFDMNGDFEDSARFLPMEALTNTKTKNCERNGTLHSPTHTHKEQQHDTRRW